MVGQDECCPERARLDRLRSASNPAALMLLYPHIPSSSPSLAAVSEEQDRKDALLAGGPADEGDEYEDEEQEPASREVGEAGHQGQGQEDAWPGQEEQWQAEQWQEEKPAQECACKGHEPEQGGCGQQEGEQEQQGQGQHWAQVMWGPNLQERGHGPGQDPGEDWGLIGHGLPFWPFFFTVYRSPRAQPG